MRERDAVDHAPSLAGQAGSALQRRFGRLTSPAGYAPAFVVLAAIPGVIALLAIGMALIETHRADRLAHLASGRIAAVAEAQHISEHRAAVAPYFTAATLTGTLAEATAPLPRDAVLVAISRDRAGVTRIEVDCPDPDALLRAFHPPASRLAWRSVAQSVTAGAGVRVTLEAPER